MALSILTLSAFSLFFFHLISLMSCYGPFWLAWVPKHLLCAIFFFWNHLWDFGVVFWAVYLVEMESVALDNSALTHS